MKKYKLTNEKHPHYPKLRRIKALIDFDCVKKGDLGGWIEKEGNLSQEGNCWVYGSALVFGSARVCGSALVFGSARVCGEMKISKTSDYQTIGVLGSRYTTLTATRELVSTGCFVGTWDELIRRSGERIWTAQYKQARKFIEANFKWIDAQKV